MHVPSVKSNHCQADTLCLINGTLVGNKKHSLLTSPRNMDGDLKQHGAEETGQRRRQTMFPFTYVQEQLMSEDSSPSSGYLRAGAHEPRTPEVLCLIVDIGS